MEHSRRNSNFPAAAAVVLLLIILSAEMASVAADTCKHLSGSFRGYCLRSESCARTCIMESNDNIDGMCLDFISKCYCLTQCRSP
ncbi:unnamed protein product [Urochloa decumbens]|uniref:Knottins-like domain-containing protein n=1 Tax=Urochloa decumbens TaxID=240449 RepID=A0ABC9ARZ2_9POAL